MLVCACTNSQPIIGFAGVHISSKMVVDDALCNPLIGSITEAYWLAWWRDNENYVQYNLSLSKINPYPTPFPQKGAPLLTWF